MSDANSKIGGWEPNDTRTLTGMFKELFFPGSGRLSMAKRNRRVVLEKIGREKCAPLMQAFVDCTKNEGKWLVTRCRDKMDTMNECVKFYTQDEKVEEYWKARENGEVPAWAAFTIDEKQKILEKEGKKNWKQKQGSSIFPLAKAQTNQVVK